MDNGFEDTDAPGPALSYDDSVPYADQVASLAERISSTKVYLLADASKARRETPTDGEAPTGSGDGEEEMETDQGTARSPSPAPHLTLHNRPRSPPKRHPPPGSPRRPPPHRPHIRLCRAL